MRPLLLLLFNLGTRCCDDRVRCSGFHTAQMHNRIDMRKISSSSELLGYNPALTGTLDLRSLARERL